MKSEPLMCLIDFQSELHQKKRRFTDFIFQRVRVGGEDESPDRAANLGPSAAAANLLRSPRSVSTSVFPGNRNAGITTRGGIPSVRATSPGAEFHDERELAAARREAAEERKRALESTPGHLLPVTKSGEKSEAASSLADLSPSLSSSRSLTVGASPSFPSSLRRFHISRPSTPSNILKATSGGIQKRRDGVPARAVLVEKLTHAPTLRGASVLETLQKQRQQGDSPAELDTHLQTQVLEEPVMRKRPVINQAERRWREQQKASISAAKEHLSNYQSAEDLDRLAQELEEVMLNMDRGDDDMDATPECGQDSDQLLVTPSKSITPSRIPPKFQPRLSNTPSARKAARAAKPPVELSTTQPDTAKEQEDAAARAMDGDSDGEYVYDTYVRLRLRPAAHDTANNIDDASNAAFPTSHDNIDPSRKDIGVVVISKEDEEIWEEFAEDDVNDLDPWDADDVDSNGIKTPSLPPNKKKKKQNELFY